MTNFSESIFLRKQGWVKFGPCALIYSKPVQRICSGNFLDKGMMVPTH